MKTWSATAPKAAIMAQKRNAIVAAARESFLRKGYSEASMDEIAALADVSVKTIYSHFENKAELFQAVIEAACSDQGLFKQVRTDEELANKFPWFKDASQRGLLEAGKQYLHHLLSEQQVALYRVITRDADRFPELGQLYQQSIAHGRTAILIAYLRRTARIRKWKQTDLRQIAEIYEALLRVDIFEKVLHGVRLADAASIAKRASVSSRLLWKLLNASPGVNSPVVLEHLTF
jgi:AcrR family transcriptional regulator